MLHDKLRSIISEYRKRFPFDLFYDNLYYNINNKEWQQYHADNRRLIEGWQATPIIFEPQRPTVLGNIRVDLPIWYGSLDCQFKVMILGSEPRDTEKKFGTFNIEHISNHVFATPFALERPNGKYHKAFDPLLESENIFCYLTDVSKSYLVGKNDKKLDDVEARKSFWQNGLRGIELLKFEFEKVDPTLILALGNDTHHFLSRNFDFGDKLLKLRHPSNGGSNICLGQVSEVVNRFKEQV